MGEEQYGRQGAIIHPRLETHAKAWRRRGFSAKITEIFDHSGIP
jgi:hypothetical protein